MMIGKALEESLRSFAKVEDEIIAFGRGADATKAVEFVHKRKQMNAQFASLRDALEADPSIRSNLTLHGEIMRLLAAFRTQNAVNQADWPAIRVRDNLPAFRAAAASVGPPSDAFWRCLEKELGHVRRPKR